LEKVMGEDKARRAPLINQLLLLIMVAMLVYLVVGFARQVNSSNQQRAELNQVEERIRAAAAEKAVAEERLRYVLSEEALEFRERQNGRTKPNEAMIILVGTTADEPLPEGQSLELESGAASPQEAWWDLFFRIP
jgi:Tfp pilus assembly protein PilX